MSSLNHKQREVLQAKGRIERRVGVKKAYIPFDSCKFFSLQICDCPVFSNPAIRPTLYRPGQRWSAPPITVYCPIFGSRIKTNRKLPSSHFEHPFKHINTTPCPALECFSRLASLALTSTEFKLLRRGCNPLSIILFNSRNSNPASDFRGSTAESK
jgi:hypothetical protein